MTTSPSTQEIQQRADAAAEAVSSIVNKQFASSAPSRQVTQATERLQNSFLALAGAFVQSLENAAPAQPSLSEGFEEAKLLESIEKWQTRYRDIEEEFDTFKEQYDALTRQYNQLVDEYDVLSEEHAAAIDTAREKTEAFAALSEAAAHVSERLDGSISRIDAIVEENVA